MEENVSGCFFSEHSVHPTKLQSIRRPVRSGKWNWWVRSRRL